MYQTADLFNKRLFVSVAFPCIAGEGDDAKVNIVQCNLEGVRVRAVFFYGAQFANIMFAIKLEWYREGYGIHALINAKNIPL